MATHCWNNEIFLSVQVNSLLLKKNLRVYYYELSKQNNGCHQCKHRKDRGLHRIGGIAQISLTVIYVYN
jgi:hypothetical protein